MKNILFINSAERFDSSLSGLLLDLSLKNSFHLLARDIDGAKAAASKAKIYFGPAAQGFLSVLLFLVFLPFLWLAYLLAVSAWKKSLKIETLIGCGWNAKMIFSPLASLLKIKTVWLELPGEPKTGRIAAALLKMASGRAEIISFTGETAEELSRAGFDRERISNVSLGVNLNATERQGNIFYNLAKSDKPYSFYKNFTVGAVVAPADRNKLEMLLRAARNCVNIIPNLRLVAIGPTPEEGNMNWLIKKLGLERRVWLVGEQKNLIQWCDDFDLYLSLAGNPVLGDLESALLAASRGVPVAVLNGRGFSDFIRDNETGLIWKSAGAEALAENIIAIEADERRRTNIGRNGQKAVWEYFDRQRQLQRIEEILNR